MEYVQFMLPKIFSAQQNGIFSGTTLLSRKILIIAILFWGNVKETNLFFLEALQVPTTVERKINIYINAVNASDASWQRMVCNDERLVSV